ncbi:MAG: peptidoglycan-binding protein, partial [Clostridiales bacterium]|nr:peptidoglycan-binding protein [Clostridiales bacterium]
AVKDFQRRNGLPVTGVFGSKELKKAKAVTK